MFSGSFPLNHAIETEADQVGQAIPRARPAPPHPPASPTRPNPSSFSTRHNSPPADPSDPVPRARSARPVSAVTLPLPAQLALPLPAAGIRCLGCADVVYAAPGGQGREEGRDWDDAGGEEGPRVGGQADKGWDEERSGKSGRSLRFGKETKLTLPGLDIVEETACLGISVPHVPYQLGHPIPTPHPPSKLQ